MIDKTRLTLEQCAAKCSQTAYVDTARPAAPGPDFTAGQQNDIKGWGDLAQSYEATVADCAQKCREDDRCILTIT